MSALSTPQIERNQPFPSSLLSPRQSRAPGLRIESPPDTTIESPFQFFRVHFATLRDHIDSLETFQPNHTNLSAGSRTLHPYRLRLIVREEGFNVRVLHLISRNAPWQDMGYSQPRLEDTLRFADWLDAAYGRSGTWDTLQEARDLYRTARRFGKVKWLGGHIDRTLYEKRNVNFNSESTQNLVNTLLVAQDTRAIRLYHDLAIVLSGRLGKLTEMGKNFLCDMLSDKSIRFLVSLHNQRQDTMTQIQRLTKELQEAIFDKAGRTQAWSEYCKYLCVQELYELHFGPRFVENSRELSGDPTYIFDLIKAVEGLKRERWIESEDVCINYLRRRLHNILLYNQQHGLLLDDNDIYPFLTSLQVDCADIEGIVGDESDSNSSYSTAREVRDSAV
ncbi:uncharacterized protein BDV14DRAFT_199963 [Aspergillus stella-maris]|uniref:uncharacterized protein n=1 Tax=Aspergillus stella-maris TaxID=1810926 RepID=UPI003CCCD387